MSGTMVAKIAALLIAIPVAIFLCRLVWRHRRDRQPLDPLSGIGLVPGPDGDGTAGP